MGVLEPHTKHLQKDTKKRGLWKGKVRLVGSVGRWWAVGVDGHLFLYCIESEASKKILIFGAQGAHTTLEILSYKTFVRTRPSHEIFSLWRHCGSTQNHSIIDGIIHGDDSITLAYKQYLHAT